MLCIRMAGILIYNIENELPQISSYIRKLYYFIDVHSELFLLLSKEERKSTPARKGMHCLALFYIYESCSHRFVQELFTPSIDIEKD